MDEGTILVYCCPSTVPSLWPSPPSPLTNVQNIQTVFDCGGEVGCWNVLWTIFHNTADRICLLKGKLMPQSISAGQFKEKPTYRIGVSQFINSLWLYAYIRYTTNEGPVRIQYMSGSDLCIPRNETARPRYFQNIIIMFSRNWEWGCAVPFWEYINWIFSTVYHNNLKEYSTWAGWLVFPVSSLLGASCLLLLPLTTSWSCLLI
jgi:hypothetical protein